MVIPTWSIFLGFGFLIGLFIGSYFLFKHCYWLLKGNPWVIGIIGLVMIFVIGWLLATYANWLSVVIVISVIFPIWLCYLFCLVKHRRERREKSNVF